MKAGPLRERLQRYRLVDHENPDTGEIKRIWEPFGDPIRAQLSGYRAKEKTARGETVTMADAAYYIRIRHEIGDGWRVKDLESGQLYNVVIEPNREKMYNLLRCSKVNE